MANTCSKTKYKILDLFSGAGGFSLGLEMLPEFKTIIAVDCSQPALDTFSKNFPKTTTICADICVQNNKKKIIEISKINNINMIIGGPPCQGFSNKGKKLGLKDPRNFLFREYLDIANKLSPEVFVIENVKSMISAANSFFINEIIQTIKKMNYYVQFGVLNASDFGVPQLRQRTVIIASKNKQVNLPSATMKSKYTVRDAISDLAYLGSGEGEFKQNYLYAPKTKYQYKLRLGQTELFNHSATNHSKEALRKLTQIPPECGKEALPQKLHGNQKFKTTWGRLKWDSQSPTIDTRFDTPSNGRNSHPELNRAITPREAARLQSFPDSFIFCGAKTEICKQIGNAVPPLLGKAIGEAILSDLENEKVQIYNDDANKVLENLLQKDIQVDHIITDPPYNISKDNNFATMRSAKRQGIDFGCWDKSFDLVSWITPASKILKQGGSIIIFTSYRNFTDVILALEKNKLSVKDVLKWIKTNPMPRNINRRYVCDTEFAIWAVKNGKPWIFNKTGVSYNRAEFHTSVVAGREKIGHPTQKSLKLMEEILKIHTNINDTVLDPFMGSGTTGVAAMKLKRRFIGVELEQKFFMLAHKRLGETIND